MLKTLIIHRIFALFRLQVSYQTNHQVYQKLALFSYLNEIAGEIEFFVIFLFQRACAKLPIETGPELAEELGLFFQFTLICRRLSILVEFTLAWPDKKPVFLLFVFPV
jgi:hypothetical protein